MASVMPKPPAAFSPLTTTKSSFQSRTSPPRRSSKIARPLRPTTSPMKRMRIRQIVVASSITDALAAAIEGQEWHEQDIGKDFGRVGGGLADAPSAGNKPLAKGKGAHGERFAASGHRRQRELRAAACELAHQRDRIDFAPDRHESRDDRLRRYRHGERPLRNGLRRRGTHASGQCIAARARLAAQLGFGVFDRGGLSHRAVSAEPQWPLERRSRVPYESRWAPYVRAHEPGQGQLP